jgi:hypothetical protein
MNLQPRQAPKSSSTGLFLGIGLIWRQFLQPNFQIMMQSRFTIVYEDASFLKDFTSAPPSGCLPCAM